ncbi:DUF5908 family protein [Ascidiimonas sp. W6]|uniref:DUF5908 family protein n=1 Tax=Ascidiimonas meishanensis TaxID=3128903 RepID=UPI0030EE35FF
MAIEIRELLIKVKIEDQPGNRNSDLDLNLMKQSILKDCKKEIQKQLSKIKER